MTYSQYPQLRASALLLILLTGSPLFAQKFSGDFTFTSLATSKVLDGNTTTVYPSGANRGDYQKWRIRPTDISAGDKRTFTIRSVATGKCLDGDGGRLYVSDCNGGNYQTWLIEPADQQGYVWITSMATGKVIDGDPEKLYPSNRNGGNYQKWRMDRIEQPRIGTAVSTAPPAYPDADPRRVHRYIPRSRGFMPGSSVESKNGKYQVYFQEDGNLVVYRLTDRPKKTLWASNTVISDVGKFSFQDDGNLVIYNRNDKAVWATGTNGRGDYMLLQNDGNLVIYNQAGVAIWASNTAE